MKATFDHSDTEAKIIRTFWFRPERPLNYTAGQYTELTLEHNNADDRGIKRWFTLSSAPGHGLVSITTKYAGDEKSSTFKRTLFGLDTGTPVELAEAMGDFVLPKDTSIPLVFIAGGIGLTPFHSMLTWLAEHGEQRSIVFIYGVRNENEVVFRSTFERARIQPHIIVSEPSPTWEGETGRLSPEMILRLAQPADNALFYISGPEPMVMGLQKDLVTAGIDRGRTVTDDFPGYTDI